ncbi:SAM-dependent methyltransferase [Kitasatospora atroaurantiaca]|uniref:tRNA-Thr(GGU) m(6)t(6)A37 methyltransferase TsaA n=1 Tax=Kitasatospora atroaurantiaca TaxID=285545 RepID=A0A561ESU3_9ACTN|nr:SAM-dependent methyltransferase [Kitasatospora atroaurantiaca]TWE18678.1 tRNA-Thr(GGU) m(6)t(6)A37 methyltransferase TsaA [Kitasatospora atroaurantiaca]
MDQVILQPVGQVVGGRTEPEDDEWGEVAAVIRLDESQFTTDAISGLEGYSHLEVVFHFHRVAVEKIETGNRHPRNNEQLPLTGIFAQRGKNRPNRIGVSRCRLVKTDGLDVHVLGLDAIDGTPVLDIKPYLVEFGPRGEVRQPGWATDLMQRYY